MNTNNGVKLRRFIVPKQVEQINYYLLTVDSSFHSFMPRIAQVVNVKGRLPHAHLSCSL